MPAAAPLVQPPAMSRSLPGATSMVISSSPMAKARSPPDMTPARRTAPSGQSCWRSVLSRAGGRSMPRTTSSCRKSAIPMASTMPTPRRPPCDICSTTAQMPTRS